MNSFPKNVQYIVRGVAKTKLGNQSLINFENADSKEEYLDNINAEEGLKNKMFKLDSRLSS